MWLGVRLFGGDRWKDAAPVAPVCAGDVGLITLSIRCYTSSTMPVYLAIPLIADNSSLNAAVVKHIPSSADRYQLQASRGWLIKFGGTTVELSDHLELTGQQKGEGSPVGSALIVPVSNYYGRGPTDMWEWLKNRLEE
jgi:hypothetical protein